jgi:hypothetical protein
MKAHSGAAVITRPQACAALTGPRLRRRGAIEKTCCGVAGLTAAPCPAALHHKTPANDNQITMFPLFVNKKE